MTATRTDEGGFTLVEVLAATAVIAIALVALTAALQHGLSGIETGRGESQAVFLVEDKLEELLAVALVDWDSAVLAAGVTTEYCRPSAFCGPTAMPGTFRRTTTVGASPCSPHCALVTVAVFYRPLTALGLLDSERRVDATVIVVSRT